jgi:putative component of toxin-antitoxin plasmid stabilization module
VRVIEITTECLEFVDHQEARVSLKFFQLLEIIGEVKIVHSHFIKKLKSTPFYELRIKAGNEYRIILFTIDHVNFSQCTKVVCLYGFQKKSTKDYEKALKQAEKLKEKYLK